MCISEAVSSIIIAPSPLLIHGITHLTHWGEMNSLTFLEEVSEWGARAAFIFPLWLLQTSWWRTEENRGEKRKHCFLFKVPILWTHLILSWKNLKTHTCEFLMLLLCKHTLPGWTPSLHPLCRVAGIHEISSQTYTLFTSSKQSKKLALQGGISPAHV